MRTLFGVDVNELTEPKQPRPKSDGWHSFSPPKVTLSPRESDVCQLLLQGLCVKEIASLRNISCKTVECQKTNLYRKLGVHSYYELLKHFHANPVVEVSEVPPSAEHAQIMKRLEHVEALLTELAYLTRLHRSAA